MTKPKLPSESKRPNRSTGDVLRKVLACPLCRGKELRVVAYGRNSARLDCPDCGLRFSVQVERVIKAMHDHPEKVVAADPSRWATVARARGTSATEFVESLERLLYVAHNRSLKISAEGTKAANRREFLEEWRPYREHLGMSEEEFVQKARERGRTDI